MIKNNYSSTIVVLNDSFVIFWTVFTSVPTTFDLHCRTVESTPQDARVHLCGRISSREELVCRSWKYTYHIGCLTEVDLLMFPPLSLACHATRRSPLFLRQSQTLYMISVFISLITRMRYKRDIKMGRLCTPGSAVLRIVGGSVTFRFLNGEAILDENMLFWVRLYALALVLKILLDFRL